MAVNSLGFGIHITVTGDFEGRLGRARTQARGLSLETDRLAKSQARATSIALKQAAALGILGGAAVRLGSKFGALTKSMLGFFKRIIVEAANFQTQMLKLKVFFGDDTASITGAVLSIAKASNIATADVVKIAAKVGQLGVRGAMAEKSISLVAQAIGTLSPAEATVATNRLSNIFQRAQSLTDLFNISLSANERAAFNAASGQQRVAVVNEILSKRFGNVFDIMGDSIGFVMPQFLQLWQNIAGIIGQPFLKAFSKQLIRLVKQMNNLVSLTGNNAKLLERVGEIIKDILAPITLLTKKVADLNLIPRFFQFLADNKNLVVFLGQMTLGVSALAAAVFTLGGSLLLFAASAKLAQSIVLPLLKGGGGGAAAALTASGNDPAFVQALLAATPRIPKGIPVKQKFFSTGFKFKTLLTPLAKIGSLFATIGKFALVALGGMILVSGALGIIAGLFKSLAGPVVDFFSFFGRGFANVFVGIKEVLTTGSISTKLFEEINDSGFGPMFRILGGIASRLFAVFKAFAGPFSTMGPMFQELVDVLKFAFIELFDSILLVGESLGLLQRDGDQALTQGIGAAVTVVVFLLKGLVKAISVTVLAFATGFRVVGGIIQFIIGLIKLVFGLVSALFSDTLFGKVAAKILGIDIGAEAQRQDASEIAAFEGISGGLSDLKGGFSRIFSQPGSEAVNPTATNQSPTQLNQTINGTINDQVLFQWFQQATVVNGETGNGD